MNEINKENKTCKFCSYCMCTKDTEGGAYCEADIHEYIPDVNDEKYTCCDFDYDDTFVRT